MSSPFRPGYNPMIRKLESVFILTDDERQALENLPMHVVALKGHQDIVREGDQPTRCCLILSGFACVYKMTVQGKRQIGYSPRVREQVLPLPMQRPTASCAKNRNPAASSDPE